MDPIFFELIKATVAEDARLVLLVMLLSWTRGSKIKPRLFGEVKLAAT